jgi:hypothetical protein
MNSHNLHPTPPTSSSTNHTLLNLYADNITQKCNKRSILVNGLGSCARLLPENQLLQISFFFCVAIDVTATHESCSVAACSLNFVPRTTKYY